MLIYLDLEGIPDEGFVYLLGMIVCEGTSRVSYSFWADDEGQERILFERFLDVVASRSRPGYGNTHDYRNRSCAMLVCENFTAYARSLAAQPIELYTCFISYSRDAPFR